MFFSAGLRNENMPRETPHGVSLSAAVRRAVVCDGNEYKEQGNKMAKPTTPKPIKGNPKDNNLVGTELSDVIQGLGGNDTLSGLGDRDTLIGGDGADALIGGSGADIASYEDSPVGLTVNLLDPTQNTGIAVGDTYNSIEKLRGSSFDDILIGDNNINYLLGGLGADVLNGMQGFDIASYQFASAGVTADLSNSLSNTGEAAGDSYISIEALQGSSFSDVLRASANGATLDGGTGGDALIGGAGFDFATYWNATAGVTANLSDASQNTGEAAGDSYVSIEGLIGTSFADTLIGDGGVNLLRGGPGADVPPAGPHRRAAPRVRPSSARRGRRARRARVGRASVRWPSGRRRRRRLRHRSSRRPGSAGPGW